MRGFGKAAAVMMVLVLLAGIVSFIGEEKISAAETKDDSLNYTEVQMAPGAKVKLELTGTKVKSIKTSSKAVATVSKTGLVTAKKKGKAIITVTGKNGKKYTCKVIVKKKTLTIAKTGVKADIIYVTGGYCSIQQLDSESDNSRIERLVLVNSEGKEIINEEFYAEDAIKLVPDSFTFRGDNSAGFHVMSNGMILCDGKGYYNLNGEKAFELDYLTWREFERGFISRLTEFNEGVASVKLKHYSDDWTGSHYLINEKGKVIATAGNVLSDRKINKKNDEIICYFFDKPSEGMTAYYNDIYGEGGLDAYSEYELMGYYDSKGKLIEVKDDNGNRFAYGYAFSEGLAAVKSKETGLIGFINKKGKLVIPCEYTDFNNFNNGMATVWKEIDGEIKVGVINKKGKVVIPFEYDFVRAIKNDVFIANKDGKAGIIDKNNKTVVPFKWSALTTFFWDDKVIFFKSGGKWGAIDYKGKTVVPFEYDGGWKSDTGNLILVGKNGKYGAINYKGKTVIPFEYDDITSVSDNGDVFAIKNGLLYIIKGVA